MIKAVLTIFFALMFMSCEVKEVQLEKIESLTTGKYELNRILLEETSTNAWLLCNDKKKCILIDPAFKSKNIAKTINKKNYTVMAIFLTHNHWDHSKEINALSEKLNAPIVTNQKQIEMGKSQLGTEITVTNIEKVSNHDILKMGDLSLEILFSPGHSMGSMCFYHEESNSLFSGDTLFKRSIGRTDFYGSESDKIINSIFTVLNSVKGNAVVFPGHGDSTTKEHELKYNPFLQ